MKTLAVVLLISTNSLANTPDCAPGAQAAQIKWLDAIKTMVTYGIDHALINIYQQAGITISNANIEFDSKIWADPNPIGSNYPLLIHGSVGDITVSVGTNTDTFAYIGLEGSTGDILDQSVINLAQDPTPTYNAIGNQTGWVCTSSVNVQSHGELYNKATNRAVSDVAPLSYQDEYDQNFPL